jgi:hypothetical protein
MIKTSIKNKVNPIIISYCKVGKISYIFAEKVSSGRKLRPAYTDLIDFPGI